MGGLWKQYVGRRAVAARVMTVVLGFGAVCGVDVDGLAQDTDSERGGLEEFESRKADEWGKLLIAEDVKVRKKAAYALWVIGRHAATQAPSVARALRDSDPYVRDVAARALEKMGETAVAALPMVVDMLTDEDEDARRVAARLCGALGSPSEEQVAILVQSAKAEDSVVRAGVAVALGHAPAGSRAARQALDRLLDDIEETVQRNAAGALARLDPIAGLKDQRLAVRKAAVAGQQHPGPRSAEVVTALVGLIRDPEEEIRARAASGLGMPGVLSSETTSVELVRELMRALAVPEETSGVRSQLIYALGRAAAWQQEAMSAVAKSIECDAGDIRFAAVIALGWSGRAGGAAVPVLMKCLSDQDSRVRAAAVRSLVAIAPTSETARVIENGLFDQDLIVRVATADSLGVLGKAGESALPSITKCLRAGPDRPTLGAIAGAVLSIGVAPDDLRRELRRHFEAEKRPPARVALALLWLEPEVQEPVVSRVVNALLSQPEHYPSVERIAQIGPRCSHLLGPLENGLKSSDRKTRMMAARALGAMREVVPEAGLALRAASNDPDPEVREVVQGALSGKAE